MREVVPIILWYGEWFILDALKQILPQNIGRRKGEGKRDKERQTSDKACTQPS